MRNIITDHTNKGLQYYVTTAKTVNDYYEQVLEAFPGITKKDVERISKFG